MFGYVRPYKPELKIKDFELYRCCYCGQCRSQKRNFGFFSAMCLNYDMTFVSLLLSAADKEDELKFETGRCWLHPLKKRRFAGNGSVDSAAALNVIFAYYKLKDSFVDNGFTEKVKAAIFYPFMILPHRRAAKKYPKIEEIVRNGLKKLSLLEKELCEIPDMAADAFAAMIKECAAVVSDSPAVALAAYHTGRLIYLLDAWEDMDKDAAKMNYNPYLCANPGLTADEIRERDGERVKNTLYASAEQCIEACLLLPAGRCLAVVNNIVSEGMARRIEEIFNKGAAPCSEVEKQKQ